MRIAPDATTLISDRIPWIIDMDFILPDETRYSICTWADAKSASQLAFGLRSWIDRTSAGQILVMTDCDDMPARLRSEGIKDLSRVQAIQIYDGPGAEKYPECLSRKVEAVRQASMMCQTPMMLYLDGDCLVAGDVGGIFAALHGRTFGLARMVRPHGWHGMPEANSGVIPIDLRDPAAAVLLDDWIQRDREYAARDKESGSDARRFWRWHEQTAISHLAVESFHGARPYTCMPLPRQWNNEHDDNAVWEAGCAGAAILHFKGGRWKRPELVSRIWAAAVKADIGMVSATV